MSKFQLLNQNLIIEKAEIEILEKLTGYVPSALILKMKPTFFCTIQTLLS